MTSETDQKTTRRERMEAAREANSEANWGMAIQQEAGRPSPERLAWEAHERGDQLFQIDLPVSWVQGWIGVGNVASRTKHLEDRDVLGLIESYGWRLEHVSTTYVEMGSSATKRLLAHDGSTEVATHGAIFGVYVFRRLDQPTGQYGPTATYGNE